MIREFIVRAEAIDLIENKIAKINVKINKWDGFEPILFTVDDYFYKKDEEGRTCKFASVKIEGEIPHYNGWTFVSSLEYDRENKCVFVHCLNKTVELPVEYRNKTSIGCDHCGHNRFRTKSFVVFHEETGEYKEVGSTCLKKFFQQDISKLIPFMKAFDDIEEKSNYGGKLVYYADTLEYFICVKYCIDKYGWISAKEAWNNDKITATNVEASRMIGSDEMLKIKTTQIQYAEKVLNYFANLDDQSNSYMINLSKVATLEFVKNNKLGILASAFTAYDRVDHEPTEKPTSNSDFIGMLGDRFKKLDVEVTFRKVIENDFGGSILYKFKDVIGNVISTFYSGYKIDLEVGEKIKLTATVTKHSTFHEEKQTSVNRMCVC